MAQKILPAPRAVGGKDLPALAELVRRGGDAGRGRSAFFEEGKANCARCHKVNGKGSDVGPDLSAIGSKFGKEGLFEAILSPSAAISHEYKVWILETRSAGFVSGYLVDDGPEKLIVRDANGKNQAFARDDIVSRTPSEASLMPEGLVGSMTADDLVDLVEFLGRLKPAEGKAGG